MSIFTNKEIIDISLTIDNRSVIYPGNVPVIIETHHQMPEDSSHLSKVTFGTHTATHVDAPKHCIIGGKTLAEMSLDHFIGECLVVDASHREGGDAAQIEDLAAALEALRKTEADLEGMRVLFKTSNSDRGFDEFYDDFVYVDGDLADYLAEQKVALVGIDYLSIKQRGSSDHRPHDSLLEVEIPILEGITLKDAEEGIYDLVCLPFKLGEEVEGGPVRAILVR